MIQPTFSIFIFISLYVFKMFNMVELFSFLGHFILKKLALHFVLLVYNWRHFLVVAIGIMFRYILCCLSSYLISVELSFLLIFPSYYFICFDLHAPLLVGSACSTIGWFCFIWFNICKFHLKIRTCLMIFLPCAAYEAKIGGDQARDGKQGMRIRVFI